MTSGEFNQSRTRSVLHVIGWTTLLAFAWSQSALAADMPVKARDYQSMDIGGWMVDPTIFVGGVYNSNVNQTQDNKISSWGERVATGFTASYVSGLHQTSIYGFADVQHYDTDAATYRTQVSGKAGFVQTYRVLRDFTVRATGDFTRQQDVFGGSAFAPNTLPEGPYTYVPTTTVSPQQNPDAYNQISGSLWAQKDFSQRAFMSLGVYATNQHFDHNALNGNRDGTVFTVTQRTGFYVTPHVYAFVDPSYSWQRYQVSTRDSDGYRVTAGLGSSAAGIWSGEVFGGYQSQHNDIIGTYSSGIYGGRLMYSPTRFWVFTASLDENLGATSIAGLTGTASKVTTALLNVRYLGLPQGWTTNARFGYVHTAIVNSARVDDGWLAGANVGYAFWRNLLVTVDYQYKKLDSNFLFAGFNQQTVSVGVTARY